MDSSALLATTALTVIALFSIFSITHLQQKKQQESLTSFAQDRKGCYLFVPSSPLESGAIDTQPLGSSTAQHPTSYQIKVLFIRKASLSPTPILKIGKHFHLSASSNDIILKLRNKVQHIPITIQPNQVNNLTMRFSGTPFNTLTLHFNNWLLYSKTFGYGFITYPHKVAYFQDLDNLEIKGLEFCKFFNEETKLVD